MRNVPGSSAANTYPQIVTIAGIPVAVWPNLCAGAMLESPPHWTHSQTVVEPWEWDTGILLRQDYILYGTIRMQMVCVWYDGKTQAGVPLVDLQTIVEMEKLLLSACVRSKEVVIPEIVENTYQNYLRMEHLKAQLKVLPDSIVRHENWLEIISRE